MLFKNKIGLAVFGALFLFSIGLSGITSLNAASASGIYDEFDRLFISTVSEIFDYEETADTIVSAEKTELYDIEISHLGLQYSFEYAGLGGFAIIIMDGGLPVVAEITTDAEAPFENPELTNVYVSHGVYWEYDGIDYYDCVSGLPVDPESVEAMKEKAFFGGGSINYDSERVDYLYRSENRYNVLSSIPIYNYGGYNGCAAAAGSNLIAYYDKTYTNLIPNYDPGNLLFGNYRFKVANATTNALAETLFNDMGTNSIVPGTTITQFRSGMSAYINRQGYSVSYTSLFSFGSLNYENAKTAVLNGKAIALFMAGFRNVTFTNENGYDILHYEFTDTNHVSVGLGCLEVNYTLPNYSTVTHKYIHSSIGVGIYRNGYINIATTDIDEALVVNVS